MKPKASQSKIDQCDKMLRGYKKELAVRAKGYRAQALKMFPHICASCCREFSGKRLRELTVHHKDHNHENNPPDGSNWELLCLYCHDHEHEKYRMKGFSDGTDIEGKMTNPTLFNPFENLDKLLKSKDQNSES